MCIPPPTAYSEPDDSLFRFTITVLFSPPPLQTQCPSLPGHVSITWWHAAITTREETFASFGGFETGRKVCPSRPGLGRCQSWRQRQRCWGVPYQAAIRDFPSSPEPAPQTCGRRRRRRRSRQTSPALFFRAPREWSAVKLVLSSLSRVTQLHPMSERAAVCSARLAFHGDNWLPPNVILTWAARLGPDGARLSAGGGLPARPSLFSDRSIGKGRGGAGRSAAPRPAKWVASQNPAVPWRHFGPCVSGFHFV